MKVLAINASARTDGNTAVLLNAALSELEKQGIETELIQLSGKWIQPCKACWACGGQANCIHRHDAFCDVFEKMKQADGILLGSPVYSANVSSIMQALLERAAVVADMNPGLFAHKVGAAVAAARRAGAMHACDTMNHFFLNHDMFVAGSSYWNVGYGRLPGEAAEDTEAMETMQTLGRNMGFLLRAVQGQNKETWQ